ncbi:MAG: HisA/HisF-related TIM barrel protein [Candidatus Omnitrophica bacterium]|nr:HisA/HisF-related TIM barrel protein [Candidatus Omnitrophota bacterium]MCM8777108.1 HisA/HisF-related TIM barrel protein [Candidatus Omnitrophota bacterium]
MLIIPAIDLKRNKVVRLYKGNFSNVSQYNVKADAVARKFLTAGVKRLHIVFLWGAHTGQLSEEKVVISQIIRMRDIYDNTCKIQVGGGLRRYSQIKAFIEEGVDYIILGTSIIISIALEEGFLKNDIKLFYQQSGKIFNEDKEIPEIDLIDRIEYALKEKVIISIDYRKNEIALSGWEVTIPLTPYYVIEKLLKKGFKRFIVTNVERDGTLNGIDLTSVVPILKKIYGLTERPEEIIVSGGITTEKDIEALQQMKYKPDGVIIGKAIYQGKLDIHTLVKKFQGSQDA